MDCSGIVLNKILSTKDSDIWSKLKLSYLDTSYSTVYSAIARYYDKYLKLPSFEELELTLRDGASKNTLVALSLINTDDIDAYMALDALVDQFTQNQTIKLLDGFLDKLAIYSTTEVKESLNSIVMELEEKTHTSENVVLMSDILLFSTAAELTSERVYLGLNNDFDSVLNGVAKEELILVGGKRGSGKSITSNNIVVNQYLMGNTSALFTIEMTAREMFQRNMSILADVNLTNMQQNNLSDTHIDKLVIARAEMFEESGDILDSYYRHRDRFKFEAELVKNKKLKSNNQMILIDDRNLSLSSIDLHLTKLKSKFEDKLRVVVVDYLNQIVHDKFVGNQFDWQLQVEISKALKNLARKHQVTIISPYQIDDNGGTRFAKGILDAADIALIMEAHTKADNTLSFSTTKIRGGPDLDFSSHISWDSLKISPAPISRPDKKTKPKEEEKKSKESAQDVAPW